MAKWGFALTIAIFFLGRVSWSDEAVDVRLESTTTTNSVIKFRATLPQEFKSYVLTATQNNSTKPVEFFYKPEFEKPAHGEFEGKIYLSLGPGTYYVTMYASTYSMQPHFVPVTQFTVSNTDDRDPRLLPSIAVESDDTEIVNLAHKIVADKTNDLERAQAIHDWVAVNIFYDFESYKVFKSRANPFLLKQRWKHFTHAWGFVVNTRS